MTAALVPVKRLTAGKSRLATALGRAGAERVALAMLEDVVEALRAVPRLDPVAVVTPDADVARAAREVGAVALVRADRGLNPSLDGAARELGATAGGLLVVLGDVAGALPRDVEALLDALPGEPGVVLAASRDGGTAALLRAPRDAIPSRFGPDSAARHRAEAARRGVPLTEPELPSLQIDLDSDADVRAFLERREGGGRTRRALRALGVPA